MWTLEPDDPRWPPLLRETPWPPRRLFVRGEVRREDSSAVAIVGSRRATAYGRAQARAIAADLASAGATIVSGLAVGVDAEAHRGALEAGGRTIAVLGSGLDRVWPYENLDLAERIVAAGGAIVSEYPAGTPPAPGRFPERNRIVAGWSGAVVVCEAAKRSGALITARLAGDAGREVYVVPHRTDAANGAGLYELLRDGVSIYRGIEPILEDLIRLGVPPAARPRASPARRETTGGGTIEGPVDLPPRLRAFLDALAAAEGPVGAAEVAARLGRDAAAVAAGLLELEILGLVRAAPGGRYLVTDVAFPVAPAI